MEMNTIELMAHTAIEIDETGVHNKVSASEEMLCSMLWLTLSTSIASVTMHMHADKN